MPSKSVIHEVERRYRISAEATSAVKVRLMGLGFAFAYNQRQVDEYYTSKYKDFIASRECLRIRSLDSRTVLTWKPPSTDDMRMASEFWKQEVEFGVEAERAVVQQFLVALDFVPYVTVTKTRTAYTNPFGIEVALDEVEGLGHFIELETQTANVDEGRANIVAVSEALGLSTEDISTIPYRDLVAAEV
jgi:adenylate cyclase, class 2